MITLLIAITTLKVYCDNLNVLYVHVKMSSMKMKIKNYSQQMSTEVLNKDYMLSYKTTYVWTDMKSWIYIRIWEKYEWYIFMLSNHTVFTILLYSMIDQQYLND